LNPETTTANYPRVGAREPNNLVLGTQRLVKKHSIELGAKRKDWAFGSGVWREREEWQE